MSKLLKRALKNSLVPAILMIAGKALGIFLISAVYGFPLEIGNDINGFFSTQIYFQDSEITLFVNSISDLLMLLVLAVPTIYLVTKTIIFQSTIDNPKTIVKMAKLNVLSWITKDDTTFLKLFIWSTFLWLASAIVVKNALEQDTYTWIAILGGVISFLLVFGTIKAFEVQIDKVYPDSKKYY